MIQRPLFNTREGYGSTIFPGVAFLIIQQTLLIGLAMLAATMREQQGTPGVALRSLLGIALAFFVIGCANIAWFTGFVFWFQDYPRAQADPAALLVSATLFVAATVAGALALGSFFRTRERPHPALDRHFRPDLLPFRPVLAGGGDAALADPHRPAAADDAGYPPDGRHQPDGRDAGRAMGRAPQPCPAHAALWRHRGLGATRIREASRISAIAS